MSPESKRLRNFRVYCGHKSDVFQLAQMCDLAERLVVQGGQSFLYYKTAPAKMPTAKNIYRKKHLPQKHLLQKHLLQKHLLQKTSAAKTSTAKCPLKVKTSLAELSRLERSL